MSYERPITFWLAARAAAAAAVRSKIELELTRRHDSGLYREGLTSPLRRLPRGDLIRDRFVEAEIYG